MIVQLIQARGRKSSRSAGRAIVSILSTWVLLGSAGCDSAPDADAPASQVCEGCNVILISVDTLRADHLNSYGYEVENSPHIQDFFSKGTVYENAYSGAPCTIPSVKQFIRGRLDPKRADPPLAKVYRDHGYSTAAFISQHLLIHGRPSQLYREGFDLYDSQAEDEHDRHSMPTRAADSITDASLAWIAERGPDEKFFAWLHYFDPHDPYSPPGAKPDPLRDRRQIVEDATDPNKMAFKTRWWTKGGMFDEAQRQKMIGFYDEEIRYLDGQLARLFRELESSGLLDRTVVLLTSDHGERLGDDGVHWDHCRSLHRYETKVPMMLRIAGEPVAGASRREDLVSTLDIYPTLLELTGIDTQTPLDGASMTTKRSDRVLLSVWEKEVVIQDARWKLYIDEGRPVRLVANDRDEHEERDLLSERSDVAGHLMTIYHAYAESLGEAQRSFREVTDELRALGYIQE